MNNIHNLTIVILTYRTNEKILADCINSIDSQANILIVENSNNSAFKEKLENQYPDLKVILSGKNLGYGGGNNFGLSKVKTKYSLILNPDVILEKNFFKVIDNYLMKTFFCILKNLIYVEGSETKREKFTQAKIY